MRRELACIICVLSRFGVVLLKLVLDLMKLHSTRELTVKGVHELITILAHEFIVRTKYLPRRQLKNRRNGSHSLGLLKHDAMHGRPWIWLHLGFNFISQPKIP